MTRKDFIERHRHQLAGIVMDALTSYRTGAEKSLFMSAAMQEIVSRLGDAYDELARAFPETKPVAGSVAGQHPKRTGT